MPKELIITDDVNLEAKDKNLLSHDSIYKRTDSKTAHINIMDAKQASERLKSGVYAILSVSDKAINNRLYDYDSLKANVMNGDWTNPYKRPFLRNHDLYYDMPCGRINNAWFIDHSTLEVSCPDGQSKLPDKVLKHYKDLKCFDEGTGSTIVEIMTTEDTYTRIKNGLDATVSQSSYMGKATCNICGEDYFGGKCSHISGRSYTIEKDEESVEKTCYVECKDFEPVELSIVNNPANNSSILFVLNSKNSDSKDSDNKEPSKDNDEIDNKINDDKVKGTESNIKDCEGETPLSDEKESKTEDLMFKDLLKKTISKNVSDKFGEEMKEHFETLFDSLEKEDQIEKLQAFLDALNIDAESEELEEESEDEEKNKNEAEDEKEPEKNENEEKEPEETPKEDKQEPETKDNKTEKSKDLENIYTKEQKVVKDSVINRTVAAMLNNL